MNIASFIKVIAELSNGDNISDPLLSELDKIQSDLDHLSEKKIEITSLFSQTPKSDRQKYLYEIYPKYMEYFHLFYQIKLSYYQALMHAASDAKQANETDRLEYIERIMESSIMLDKEKSQDKSLKTDFDLPTI